MDLIGGIFLGACIFGGLWTLGNEIRKGLIEAAEVSAKSDQVTSNQK